MSEAGSSGHAMRPVRTRFAPSPTGFLHIGGARTALFSWLYAKKHGGQCVLRIEDTDAARSTPEHTAAIIEGLTWLELDFGDGSSDGNANDSANGSLAAPYQQSARLALYQEKIADLLARGLAYHCHCTPERLDEVRAGQRARGEKPRYDGHCRDLNLPPAPGSVVRFKTPLTGTVAFTDRVYGDICVDNAELDDLVIQRADGLPTYNLAVVVDDIAMGITHVVRGEDHINNTARQCHMYAAFGAELPTFAHLPMVLGEDGKRFSKRHGAVSVAAYREMGILPEALVNYLLRLGFGHGDKELFDPAERVALFDMAGIHRAPAQFDLDKLLWFNQQYLQAMSSAEVLQVLEPYLAPYLAANISDMTANAQEMVVAALPLFMPRARTLCNLAEDVAMVLNAPTMTAEVRSAWLEGESLVLLRALQADFSELIDAEWNSASLMTVIKARANTEGVKMPAVAKPLRAALTGAADGVSVADFAAILGRTETLARIARTIA